ncbi:MAG: ABC transporter substrate-binding protein [Pseudomonadota bacterium]
MKINKAFVVAFFSALLLVFSLNVSHAYTSKLSYHSPVTHLKNFVSTNNKVAKGAENFIDSMGKRAITFLDSDMSQERKEREFRKLLKDSFDLTTIGRFSLGRHWRVASDSQKKEYQKLFEDLIVDVYSQRFGEYKGQALAIRSSRSENEKDTIVQSFIVDDNGAEFSVDWRVRFKNGRYRIIDVIIEGVSMSLTQRSDFSSVIQRGGGNVDVLIAHLKGQN